MALTIKNPETEKLARELARRRKQRIAQVVTDALRKEVERERRKPTQQDFAAILQRIEAIVNRFNLRPVRDDRTDA